MQNPYQPPEAQARDSDTIANRPGMGKVGLATAVLVITINVSLLVNIPRHRTDDEKSVAANAFVKLNYVGLPWMYLFNTVVGIPPYHETRNASDFTYLAVWAMAGAVNWGVIAAVARLIYYRRYIWRTIGHL